jgi:hypothetical protein
MDFSDSFGHFSRFSHIGKEIRFIAEVRIQLSEEVIENQWIIMA